MKILSWNCRGIGNPATVKELRDLAKDYAPSVMFIMETQISKYQVEILSYLVLMRVLLLVVMGGVEDLVCSGRMM